MMNAIIRVTIENFQSHKETMLDFVNGLNVIVGPSDQGKSAILRAIKWVLFNEPRGTEFIRHGTSSAKVTLEFSNGNTVIRERSKSKNRYTVIDKEGKVSIFEGFGNEIPEEVIKAHGIPKIMLDSDITSSLNISDQLEGAFLLSESGSVRAKAIGRLTGLHIIDKALRDSSIDLRREAQTADRLKNELQAINQRLSEFENLESIKIVIEESENIIKLLEGLTAKKNILDIKKKSLEEVNNTQLQTEVIIRKTSRLKDIEAALKKASDLKTRLGKLFELQNRIGTINKEIEKTAECLEKTQGLEYLEQTLARMKENSSRIKELSALSLRLQGVSQEVLRSQSFIKKTSIIKEQEKVIEKINEKVKRYKECNDLLQRYNIITNHLAEGNKYLEKNFYDMETLLKEYSSTLKKAGKCPLCKSEINGSVIDEVIRHYREVH